MLKVENNSIKPLVQLMDWNMDAYCDQTAKVDEFKTRLNRIKARFEEVSGVNDVELDDDAVIWINEVIENAWNHPDECGVTKEILDKLLNWIRPINLNR